jgi:hypothetical protein
VTKRRGTSVRAAPVARARGTAVLIHEVRSHLARAEDLVHGLGYRAIAVEDAGEAARMLASDVAPELALVGLPGGDAVARAARGRGEDRPSLVVAVSGTAAEAMEAADSVAADAFLVRPYRRDALANALRAAEVVRARAGTATRWRRA